VERLRAADLRRLLRVLDDLASAPIGTPFPDQALAAVAELVPCDVAAYNEIDPRRGTALVVSSPAEVLFSGAEQILAEHAGENPIVRYHQSGAGGSPLKLSDFLGRRELHKLPLYQLLYREVGIEHQMAFMLSAPPVVGVSLNRARLDFSERDRILLATLRPHLRHAHLVQSAMGALSEALEAGGQAVILLGPSGEFQMATEQAQRWLREYFGDARSWNGVLPEAVVTWLRRQHRGADRADDLAAVVGPLIVRDPDAEQPARTLRLRLMRNLARERGTVLLSEETDSLSALLSRREIEVLQQAALGRTDAEIADELFVSRRTINWHLQHIYRKLGVPNRSAAVARFTRALRIL
jgi:DNA-binding CsgD family transcriptional regulator